MTILTISTMARVTDKIAGMPAKRFVNQTTQQHSTLSIYHTISGFSMRGNGAGHVGAEPQIQEVNMEMTLSVGI